MKKLLIFLIASCLLLSLVSCDQTVDGENETAAGNAGNQVTDNYSQNTTDNEESKTENKDETENENLAPDFSLIDWNGNTVKLSDLRGKPVVLNFWESGCAPCRNEMPDFEEAYKEYGDRIQFMMVNFIGFFSDTVDSAKAFINDQGYTFPVYFDTEHNAAAAYGINSIPQTFFIDEKGELIAVGKGMLDAESLERGINMILE